MPAEFALHLSEHAEKQNKLLWINDIIAYFLWNCKTFLRCRIGFQRKFLPEYIFLKMKPVFFDRIAPENKQKSVGQGIYLWHILQLRIQFAQSFLEKSYFFVDFSSEICYNENNEKFFAIIEAV